METTILERSKPVVLTERDAVRIREMERYVEELQFMHNGQVFDIPEPLRTLLQQAVSIMAVGDSVGIVPLQKELTTQEAADLLGVSRPYIVKLLEEGEIRFRKVGAHRRVQLSHVLAYKERQDREMEQGLDEMADFLAVCGTYGN
jgi:excisionase family DNA binding protein